MAKYIAESIERSPGGPFARCFFAIFPMGCKPQNHQHRESMLFLVPLQQKMDFVWNIPHLQMIHKAWMNLVVLSKPHVQYPYWSIYAARSEEGAHTESWDSPPNQGCTPLAQQIQTVSWNIVFFYKQNKRAHLPPVLCLSGVTFIVPLPIQLQLIITKNYTSSNLHQQPDDLLEQKLCIEKEAPPPNHQSSFSFINQCRNVVHTFQLQENWANSLLNFI